MVKKIIAIIQARTDSKRLPNKVLCKLGRKTVLETVIFRVKKSTYIDEIILATTNLNNDKKLLEIAKRCKIKHSTGSENDVLDRYYITAKKNKAHAVVRITADCPLIDYNIIDNVIKEFKLGSNDYVSNTLNPHYPDGMDIEIFTFKSLEYAWKRAKNNYDREHVTPYLKKNKNISKKNVSWSNNQSNLRLTLDTRDDLDAINKIYEYFNYDYSIQLESIIENISNGNIKGLKNQYMTRDYGSKISSGSKIWDRATKIIPGGNMLLSKRPDMFLPDKWPTYFSKAKGCYVWDLDGKKYADMGLMGVGTNILGYGNQYIDKKVSEAISLGNLSSLNCPEEVILAEKLVELHPWAGMVKFCRTGGEANAVAIRIARAASNKNNVAVCGYHGWHDWYLASNLSNKDNLNTHLLSGLETEGVNTNLKNTVFTFEYNNFDELKNLVKNKNIGVIKMEVMRNFKPKNNFLKRVAELAKKENIILIFDECTSGFRETYGGLHLKYKITPDIAIFGKALGNGYAITAIVGRTEVMEYAQKSFISSTFWTERIGPTAAIETLRIMKSARSWEIITNLGIKYLYQIRKIAKNNKVKIQPLGLPSLQSYIFQNKNHQIFKTYITQEMLKRRILATNSIYFSTKHTENMINNYLDILNDIFYNIRNAINTSSEHELLDGSVAKTGFTRVN